MKLNECINTKLKQEEKRNKKNPKLVINEVNGGELTRNFKKLQRNPWKLKEETSTAQILK